MLELAQAMAVPSCGLLLADMGADVIKVEPPAGDAFRLTQEPIVPGESKGYAVLNRGKRSVAVAEAAGLLNAACRGYTNLSVLYTTLDPARAIAICQRGLEIATRIGDLGFQSRLLTNLAVACCTFTDRCSSRSETKKLGKSGASAAISAEVVE